MARRWHHGIYSLYVYNIFRILSNDTCVLSSAEPSLADLVSLRSRWHESTNRYDPRLQHSLVDEVPYFRRTTLHYIKFLLKELE